MRFCPTHWDDLKDRIKDAGLYDLVPQDGEAATKMLASNIEDGGTAENFDPLMGAHNLIFANALDAVGLVIMADGVCPLCYLLENCQCGGKEDCDVRNWTKYAAEAAKKEAQRLGMVP
jgi:hypothetical protein